MHDTAEIEVWRVAAQTHQLVLMRHPICGIGDPSDFSSGKEWVDDLLFRCLHGETPDFKGKWRYGNHIEFLNEVFRILLNFENGPRSFTGR